MHIFFSVGEPSGDQHAAALIEQLRRQSLDIRISGFGGPKMREQGCELLFALTEIAVMGFFRVLPKLRQFAALVRQADEFFERERPDAVVLIDIPGFNWWIARKAKARGIRVFYYLPPQLWAWAPWRVSKVRRFVDHVLSGLSFEVEWYRQRGIDCQFVGHPFFDEVANHPLDESILDQMKQRGGQQIALLPGSRDHEVHHNFPVMLQIARQLRVTHSDLNFHVACYNERQREMCRELITTSEIDANNSLLIESLDISLNRTSEIIEAADCCLMVSGSVSLELLSRRKPGVVLYHGTHWLMLLRRIFMTCRYVTLPNLMAGREIMPEFVFAGRGTSQVERMTSILSRWLSQPIDLANKRNEMQELAADVAQPGGSARTATFILNTALEESVVSVSAEPQAA